MGHDKSGYLFENDRMTAPPDWLNYIMSLPVPLEPGEKMVYGNEGCYLLSLIVEKITGRTLMEFLNEELLRPMGFFGVAGGICPKHHTLGATEMFATCEDVLKLGRLYLDGGVWEGKRYLSEEWVREATKAQISDGFRYYGYSFWKNDLSPVFYGDGAHGQYLIVDPEQNAVLAVQSYCDRIHGWECCNVATGKK